MSELQKIENNLGLDGLMNEPYEPVDVSGFEPAQKKKPSGAEREEIKAVSEQAGFQDRDPKPTNDSQTGTEASSIGKSESPEKGVAEETQAKAPERERQVYRTGRNIQHNMKIRRQDQDELLRINKAYKWPQGLIFEYALEALQEKLETGIDSEFWKSKRPPIPVEE